MQPPDEQAHAELVGCHIQASSAATVPHFEVEGEANSSTVFYQEAPEKREDTQQVVIFFMGDHVEATEGIVARLNNADGVIAALRKKFRQASVMVVKPTSYSEGCFACYTNFLPTTTRSGEPLGFNPSSLRALRHLRAVLHTCFGASSAEKMAVTLLGFSKGGAVLNQLLAEIAHVNDPAMTGADPAEVRALVHSVHAVHYLDVGANGRGAYPTDPRVHGSLAALATQQPLRVYFHGTPRQWEDAGRPWILEEKNRSLKLMREARFPAAEHLYFGGEEPSMEMHFRIVDAFETTLTCS
mmetsp:Transcript_10235/g.17614  ORF Transcript_10235/g.17614 Transcript_10235/m.17614 type:complete len:298 (+) Transcript_10235:302-1195(+)|eukprot:CAMPEP_0198199842 /NCGR_PEP_ID=MMETSP1445-20131203/2980_1 /TAXON_ID=36898 /ORGANISM="Pyramimonas sp., Strain CCMP2087" /LENGTH=297 /DNA_ID=CAMNT_0043869743 /DNA_START=673 /DNA_END=1566 /DNA_ORIENTATION=-